MLQIIHNFYERLPKTTVLKECLGTCELDKSKPNWININIRLQYLTVDVLVNCGFDLN